MPRLLALLVVLACIITSRAEVVAVGAGSYLQGLPPGAKGPPGTIFRTEAARGRMPTNDWWSSLAWVPLSEAMYPHPLAVKAVEGGLRVSYPGASVTANKAAIFGFMGAGVDDLVLGHSQVATFSEARVHGWSDWFVTARLGSAERGMAVTFGHGSPYVFADFTGGEPVVAFAKPPEVLSGGAGDAALVVRTGPGRVYGLYAPAGSTWSGLGTAKLAARTGGKAWFSLAVLPDETAETQALFRRHAHAHVTDSRVTWSPASPAGRVATRFELATTAREGTEEATLTALYPHQWRATDAALTGHAYASVRGPMKLAAGNKFATTATLPPLLPALPLAAGVDRAEFSRLLAADMAGPPQLRGDTYGLGKQLGKWATLLPLAEQAGEKAAAAECERRLRTALEDFFTVAEGERDGFFALEPTWGTLIGLPASFGSDAEVNDHHFHYGYFIRAAGELARRDAAWAAKWAPMVKLLARDIASADERDPLFPRLRCFDPYAGHSWASGHAKFGDGNNNESSSEAVNAWFGLMLFGEATGDAALRDLGAWLLATEVAAIEDYWFGVHGDTFHRDYPASVVTMVWGGKGANGTWFSGEPEAVHGINFLPVTGASLYLGRHHAYAAKNWDALLAENLERGGRGADGGDFRQWADVLWMFRAVSDPADALRRWNARPADFKPEAGNSRAQTAAWITSLHELGTPDAGVTADAPFAATFVRSGVRRHAAWNVAPAARTVTFSDGTRIQCPPRALVVK